MTRLSRPRVHRESATSAGTERGRTLSRRPPAIAPLRVTDHRNILTDHAPTALRQWTQETTTDLPRVVLRIPQLGFAEPVIPFTEVVPKRTGKRRFMLAVVTIVIAILGFLLLRGERPAKQKESVPPIIDAPGWKPAVNPQQQPALSWREAPSAVPPTTSKLPGLQGSQPPVDDHILEPYTSTPTPAIVDSNAPPQGMTAPVFGERYPDYRMADRSATLDRPLSGSSPPAVIMGKEIGKVLPEIR